MSKRESNIWMFIIIAATTVLHYMVDLPDMLALPLVVACFVVVDIADWYYARP